MSRNAIYLLSARRSAIGRFGGSLKDLPPADLLTPVMQAAISDSGLPPDRLERSVIGNVLHTAPADPYLARYCALKAGLSHSSTALAVNRLCGSGLEAVIHLAMGIRLGEVAAGIAGGVESMSRAPHIAPDLRFGHRLGDSRLLDMLPGPLTDPFGHGHMGETTEHLARECGIDREAMDALALSSQRRAQAAIEAGHFDGQIVPIEIPGPDGPRLFQRDEHPRPDMTREKLAALRPAFVPDGAVTAGNSSGINDGAAALVLCDAETARQCRPMAQILAWGHAGVEPRMMGLGPVPASRQALARAGITASQLHVVESNEAFAAQACAVTKALGLDPAIVNPNGGAIALGHPIGATGAILLVKLVHELIRRDGRYGLATLCIGGGQGVALVVENLQRA
ncbi:MAG: acetyl-CoA C-acyltransferase [Gammaproteobacteria bacterium]|nr:MAG: acetyl-CoA C-acyltransferase [Gammaproteobacteria bacterium]